MEQSSVFQSNGSQAVRLPKALGFPDGVRRVNIIAVGRSRIITPVGEAWDIWFDAEGVSDDFIAHREQPGIQDREAF